MNAFGKQRTRKHCCKGYLPSLLVLLTLFVAISLQPQLLVGTANAQSSSMKDLTPFGWIRDTSAHALSIDRYRSQSGSIALDLLAFPPTTENARDWSVTFINTMLKPDLEAGRELSLIDADETNAGSSTGPMNTSEPGLDMSTHTVQLRRSASDTLLMQVRTIIRSGQPVQVSLWTYRGERATDEENAQASRIAYDARLPINKVAVVFPLEDSITLTTVSLIYAGMSDEQLNATDANPASEENAKPVAKPSAQDTSKSNSSGNSNLSGNGKAPELRSMPGPRVQLTQGKMLESVPDGYRMQIFATHYWTSRDLSSTRRDNLALTKDGQFEKSHFAISGGNLALPNGGGLPSVVSTGDKHGTTGSVAGDTNPQGGGTRSLTLNKREGLDPDKYGVYYISGNTIELRHASGKTTTHEFRTDGYYLFDLDDKRYFSKAPDGWELEKQENETLYRSIDGSYLAQFQKFDTKIKDGRNAMNAILERMKGKGLIVSATSLTHGKAGIYDYARSVVTLKNGAQLVYFLRYGRLNTLLINFTPYDGAKGLEVEVDFVRAVD